MGATCFESESLVCACVCIAYISYETYMRAQMHRIIIKINSFPTHTHARTHIDTYSDTCTHSPYHFADDGSEVH
jgi:hypothetical protein